MQFIESVLDEYFPNPSTQLNYTSPYTLLIAVLLSAQCTDKQVNKVTPLLFKKAKTPEEMIVLGIYNIEKIIFSIGLNKSKSRYIYELSKILIKKYKSIVPDTIEELQELPGVGRKTASAVVGCAFKKPAFPVDTHVYRLAHRWGLSKSKSFLQVERDLRKLFNKNDWYKRHLQMICFARRYCSARAHDVKNCPICSNLINFQPVSIFNNSVKNR